MTNKFLLNLLGFNPDVTNRKSRHAIESIVSRLCLASLICLCMLTIGVGTAWGYTGSFSAYTNSTLIDGYYVIGASTTASNKNYCAGTTVSTGRLTGQTLTTSNPSDNYVWIIEETSSGWTFNSVGSPTKYIKQTSTTSGKGLAVGTDIGYFTLSGYNSSSPVGFKFTSKDQNSINFLKYNNGSKWFSNYANAYSTTMTPVTLYRDGTKFRAKTTQPTSGSFTASATGATWDGTKKHLSWMSSGTTVTLTATPPTGKAVSAWTVTKATGGTVTVTNNKFNMPADQVTISVTWKDAGTSVTLSKAAATNGSFKLSSSCGGSELSPLSVTTTDAAQTVYVKATPASGYQVASVTSKLGSAAAVPLSKDGDCYPVTYAKGASGTAVITVTFETASCSSYSFHDGTNGSSDWQINCFEYSGNADRQWIKNMTIRNKSHYYVGKQGNFYNDGLGNSNAKSYTNQMQYMQLALDRGHNSNNQLGSNYAGVKGTLLCYDNSNSDNLYVDFLPDGYYFILDAAGTPTALPMTCTNPDMTAANILSHNTVWETDIQTITYVNKKYTVGIKADASIAGKAWQTTRYNTNEDMTTLKKRNSSGGFTGTLAAADVTAGTRGKYRIWADNFSTTSGEKNWYAHFVPYYHVTYNGNGASGSVAASADVSCEASAAERTVKAAANGFTVPAHTTFGGWATSKANADAGTVAYAAGADIVLTSDVTLYAIWTPEAKATITLNNYSGSAPTDKYPGETWTLPSTNSFSCNDKTFVGWSTVPVAETNTKPTSNFYEPGASVTLAANNTFYAVFAEGGGNDYELVTSSSTALAAGDNIILVSSGEAGSAYAMGKKNDNNRSAVSVTIADGAIIENPTIATASNNTTDIYPFVLEANDGAFAIKDAVNNLYLTANGAGTSGNNYLRTTEGPANATTQKFTISVAANGVATITGNNTATNARNKMRYNSSSTIFSCYASGQNDIYIYRKPGGSAYSTTCAACEEVTVKYSAPDNGNAMTVKKGSTTINNNDAVRTCSAVDLTVTLTPATHYTATGLAATGVTGVTVSNVGNVYTVNIPADATGTLTLTPTFTPETPLTITLNTNGKGTYTDPAEWPIYAGESFTLPDVTPSDPTCATFVGWIQGTTFPGDATTHDAPLTISAGSSSGELSVNTTYTAVFYETETAESDAYVKVTSAPVNWANDHYLIVYEDGGVAFDGSLSTLDASSNTVAVSISSGAIAATSALAASEWKIALISGSNYSIQSASGKYIGNASNSNGLTADNTALDNTLSISSENFGVVSAGGAYLRYNATSGQERFRYYKSSSYSSQQAIQLYKLGTAVVETRTYTTNPACTPKYRVTVASVTGGSPNANPKFLPENEEVTLTANPAAGYSFTSWTITKTTGGDDVTTTLLGANATTANTSFSMPAYDVTVTASFAKIPVASLQIKDGETVIANSGTVNISTGANKTLTVVVTPADAFDHSWSASVTGGGTYASITNVQAGTFQVNGLAQGDATVTVTAPNDGDAKTVTFTVHVTDILPTEVVLKRDGSNTSISELSIYEGQYVKVNVSFTPTPTNKDFSVSADGTFVTIHAQAHTNPNYYATLNGKKVTTSPVNVTFTSAATSSVTKNLVVTVLPLLTDTFVDYIHGQATQTVSARLSVDKFTLYTDINTPSLSDASDADPTSADCETSHYHLIGWLPKATAEALWAAGTAITESTEGLVKAGVQVEATGQTWYAIWGKEQ